MVQSPELAGGAGFTFEDNVTASYLVALLAQGEAPGIANRVVTRVSLQQKSFGNPLDDIVVDFEDAHGDPAQLTLQAKRKLVISSSDANEDFRDIIKDAWATLQSSGFRHGVDRYGAAVGEIALDKSRDLATLCELARASMTAEHFQQRFAEDGNASKALTIIKLDIEALITKAAGAAPSPGEIHEFLKHFVLIDYSFMHDGAIDPPMLISRVRDCLASSQAGHASAAWKVICQIAREADGKSGQVDRTTLVRALAPTFLLRGAPALRDDLRQVTELSRAWVADIGNKVDGFHIDRARFANEIEKALASARWVQIRGLAGSGKSVVLRQAVEAALKKGPTLFLHSDRLVGNGWASFATANGLSAAPLKGVLVEIAALGSSTLFIDGIDRVTKEHQGIVLDLVRTILTEPVCDNWRIVASLRDTGIEPLRNWLGELLETSGISTVEVGSLDEKEAEALADAKPALRSLLFGQEPAQSIVRRPFFAKILAQTATTDDGGASFSPKSEGDLLDHWWRRGGFNVSGQEAILRRRALIELATLRARSIGHPIAISQASPQTVVQIHALTTDGIIQDVSPGHTIRFAHDIFFEWALYHVFIDRAHNWLNALKEFGEPPAIARVVELLSQSQYLAPDSTPNAWISTLQQIAASGMRSQWVRAWLLGPIALNGFMKIYAPFLAAVLADDCAQMGKALVWIQAEKTVPNANILATSMPKDQRLQAADLLSWPSDMRAWANLVSFVIINLGSIPKRLYPDIVAAFEVWQNLYGGFANPISESLLKIVANWLREIDAHDARPPSKWGDFGNIDYFRNSLATTLIRAAAPYPALTEEMLRRALASDRLDAKTLKLYFDFSKFLAASHPSLLVDVTSKALRGELPADEEERENREREGASERRRQLRAKPEAERTDEEKRYLETGGSSFFGSRFSYHDFQTLAIDRVQSEFFPSSPRREPWGSLFEQAPDEALRLLRELSNHAIAAWRQLHNLVHDRQGTPIPLELDFPWGQQRFWGDTRIYLWSRGQWGPEAIASGYMALEAWCFDELERGRDVDDLIQQIVAGNECIAILGTTVALALYTSKVSETVFPIVTAQRLWVADKARFANDLGGQAASLTPFTKKEDLPHAEAVRLSNARPVRQRQLSWLAPHYVLAAAFSDRAMAAIADFPNNLPFDYEEQKGHAESQQYLAEEAQTFAELADLKNYQAMKTEKEEEIAVVHVSPSAGKPEAIEKATNAQKYLSESALFFWGTKTIEHNSVQPSHTLPNAIRLARESDDDDLFTDAFAANQYGMRRGAVAATAAVALRFRDGLTPEDLQWARRVVERARLTAEANEGWWHASASIPWHPCIFAASALVDDLRQQTAPADAAKNLLALVAHPLEGVSLAALQGAMSLWQSDMKLSWAALVVAFQLCLIQPTPPRRRPTDPTHSPEYVQATLDAALQFYAQGTGWLALPPPPAAWVKIEGRKTVRWRRRTIGDAPLPEMTEDDWGAPETSWNWQFAAKIIGLVPLEAILASEAKPSLVDFLELLLAWTIEKNNPPWARGGGYDSNSTRIFEWTSAFSRVLGKLWGYLDQHDAERRFISPILALGDDQCWAMISPAVDMFLRVHLYDSAVVPPHAIPILTTCLERFLKASAFRKTAYRAGRLSGFNEPELARSLMFVSIERAALAARLVNGNWSELSLIMPVVERFVGEAGWIATVMAHFITLCERASAVYPASTFADQILGVLKANSGILENWHGTMIPARIASLIQKLAHRDAPLPLPVAQRFLRILDYLVDMGDRRSAALQLSETFREIRLD